MRKLFLPAVFISLFLFSCSSEDTAVTPTTPITTCIERTCGDFSTQPEAQAAFDADPTCYDDLDRDGDGIACESLPG